MTDQDMPEPYKLVLRDMGEQVCCIADRVMALVKETGGSEYVVDDGAFRVMFMDSPGKPDSQECARAIVKMLKFLRDQDGIDEMNILQELLALHLSAPMLESIGDNLAGALQGVTFGSL